MTTTDVNVSMLAPGYDANAVRAMLNKILELDFGGPMRKRKASPAVVRPLSVSSS